uniref:Heat shock factor-binding protein 1 n=1 Tax=Panagrellus redivivus TaxID=6233 RepID=A0A7E4VT04_PANRE
MENDREAPSDEQLNQMSKSVGTLMELIAGMHLLNFDLFKNGVEDVQNLVAKLQEIKAVNNNNNGEA